MEPIPPKELAHCLSDSVPETTTGSIISPVVAIRTLCLIVAPLSK